MDKRRIQDFCDKRMTNKEHEEFQLEMASNAQLNREVDALNSFKNSIKDAAKQEYVPNLQPMLANVARPNSNSLFQKWITVGIGAIAIFGIVTAINRMVMDQTNPVVASAKVLPAEGHLERKSPQRFNWNGDQVEVGIQKIKQYYKRPIPTIDIQTLPGAEFVGAASGSCWINFRYTYKGDAYEIYGRCETGNLDTGQKLNINNQTVFVFSDAVGWYDKGNMTYTCLGGTHSGRLAVAQEAMKTTSTID